jgi:predicted nucleic acid-binding protein
MKGVIYADPSLLVSTLIQDANTERAFELVGAATRIFAITDLVELEIRNALELAAYRFPRALEAVERANERFAGMLASGHWRMMEIDFRRSLQRARGLSIGHTRKTGCRSLDILHVAGAMELGIRKFWSLDEKQRAFASAAGLDVSPNSIT